MKLFSRHNRLSLLATVTIFLLASIAYYFLLRLVIIDQLDDNLKIEKEEIENYVAKYNRLPEIIPVKDQKIFFKPATVDYRKTFFEIVSAYDDIEKETGTFRQLNFTFKLNGRWHQAVVGKSMEGTEDLIQSIIVITICTIILILVASFIINRIVLNKLWQPFYHSLNNIKNFKIGKKDAFVFPNTNIEEFTFMNDVLQQAIIKADQDYLILKEFTENASHEMQTPLAIIRSKLDLLIQDENLSLKHGANVQALYEAIEKLTKLNRSLLLLTKIENNQFKEISEIALKNKIEDKLTQFQEILSGKKVHLNVNIDDIKILMNTDLADILLNNLISNAVKHNMDDGLINITLKSPGEFTISNTGPLLALNQQKIFTRFYKSEHNSEHTGLGLSIIKQTCNVSGLAISYNYGLGIHTFKVTW